MGPDHAESPPDPGGRILLLLLLGLGLRCVALVFTGPEQLAFGDARDYLETARAVCGGGPYPERGSLPFFRAPGLPLFLAAASLCNLGSPLPAKLAVLTIDSLSIVLVGLLADRFWKSRRATLIAAGLAAVHPLLVLQATDLRSEPIFAFMLLLALLFLLFTRDTGRPTTAVATGLALGLAALTRPVALALLPLFALAALGRPSPVGLHPHPPGAGGRSGKSRFALALCLSLGFFTTLAPWMAYTHHRFGEVILVNDAGGYNLWRGSTPAIRKLAEIEDPAVFAQAAIDFESMVSPTMAAGIDARGESPMHRNRLWVEQAWLEFRAEPGAWFGFTLRKAANFWRPWLDPIAHSPFRVFASGAWNGSLLLLGGFGLREFHRRDAATARVLVALILLAWAAHVPFQLTMRMRIPFTAPLAMALAAPILGAAWDRLERTLRRSRRVPRASLEYRDDQNR